MFSCILTCRPSCLLLSGHSAHRRTQAHRRRWGRESSHQGWWAQSREVGSSRSFSATGCFRWLCLSTGCPGSPGCSTPLLVEEEVIGKRGNKPFSPLCGLENILYKPKVSWDITCHIFSLSFRQGAPHILMRKSQTRLPFGPTEKYDEFEISEQNTKR